MNDKFTKHLIVEAETTDKTFTQNAASKVDLSSVEAELAKVLNIPKPTITVNFRTTKDLSGSGSIKLKRKDMGVFYSVITKSSINFTCFTKKEKSKIFWRFIFNVEANIKNGATTAWMDDNYIGAQILIADYNTKTGKWEFK